MQILFPALAAILQAASFTLDKVTLSFKKVTYKTYMGISFPLIVIFTAIIFFAFGAPFSLAVFQGKFLILILISIALAILGNLVYYRALKNDHLSEMQTIELLKNIPLILFASIFFVDERNILNIILALIAAIAIVLSHWEKHHFHLARKTWIYMVFTLLIAPFSGLITKALLEVWNPIAFQLFRDIIMAAILVPLYFREIKNVNKKAIPYLLITNLLTTIAWILYLFSYQRFGIVYTVLIFSMQPLLVYIASLIFLKEKFHKKKAIGFVIILIAIAAAQVFK